jgi:hypothetical protein
MTTIYYYSDQTCSDVFDCKKTLHREGDLPAIEIVETDHSTRVWYKNGKFYRQNDKPVIENTYSEQKLKQMIPTHDESKVWLNQLDQYHREDNPAVIFTHGGYCYMQHNNYHRLSGPALRFLKEMNGMEWIEAWYVNGELIENGQQIWDCTEKSQFAQYLTSPIEGERLIAQEKLKLLSKSS